MFELRNSGKNRRERSEIFGQKFTKGVWGFDLGKKELKLFHACVPLTFEYSWVSSDTRFQSVYHKKASVDLPDVGDQ